MADAECYQKTVDDRTIILNVRSYYFQPFITGDWTDLRLGFFLSLTDAAADDMPNGVFAETISTNLSTSGRYNLGVSAPARPGFGGQFIGFTNTIQPLANPTGNSVLVSSDAAVGTTNTNFWRPANSIDNRWGAAIYDGYNPSASIVDDIQQHFPQNPAAAGGYAVLLALQLLRDNPTSRILTVRIKSSPKSADMLYSNTPTKELIQQTMENWPASKQMGPVALSQVPSSFFFYWPFTKTRLRIHSLGLLLAA